MNTAVARAGPAQTCGSGRRVMCPLPPCPLFVSFKVGMWAGPQSSLPGASSASSLPTQMEGLVHF